MKTSYKRALWIGGGLAVVAALAAPKLLSSGNQGGGAPGGAQQGPQLVTAQIVQPDTLRDFLTATGTVQAFEAVNLRSEVSGRVTRVDFQEGTQVRQGQLLVKVFDDDLQAQLESAESARDLAELQIQRQRELLQEGGTSQQAFDEAENALRTAEARIRELRAQIDRTEIRAPFTGTIGLRQVSPGAFLSPGDPIASLQMLDPVKVDFSVPERYVGQIEEGDAITFSVRGLPDAFAGTVYAAEPAVDEQTRTLRFRARADNPDRKLRPGAFARIQVTMEETADALLVPTVSVVPSGQGDGGQILYVIAAGQAQPQPVQTGVRTAERVQISQGLAPGDTVVTSGVQNLRPGVPVRIDSSANAFAPEQVEPSGPGVE